MVVARRRAVPVALLALSLGLPVAACERQAVDASGVLTTHVSHTDVKRQSIGNCWLYAQATWLESMILSGTGESVNVSESYWTYWHWHDQIVGSSIPALQTGGWWWESKAILMEHGFVKEEDFIPDEASEEMSAMQAAALETINEALKEGGSLAKTEDRTPEKVRAALDKAFGHSMADAEAKARKADKQVVGKRGNQDVMLSTEIEAWRSVSFPAVYGKDTPVPASTKTARKDILRRVMKALNDNKPVVMTMMIDFNAMDAEDKGSFKFETLAAAGATGRQGGHMVVLHDYTVDNVPGVGSIGEGDVSEELQAKALDGDLNYFVAKNSWGTNRPERGITDGYTRFFDGYLTKQLEWKDEGQETGSFYTTLQEFVLPPGY
jgi:hypothetical protein